MTFVKKYEDNVFLSAMSSDAPMTADYISKITGSNVTTAKRALEKMEESNKVMRIPVNNGEFSTWVRVI